MYIYSILEQVLFLNNYSIITVYIVNVLKKFFFIIFAFPYQTLSAFIYMYIKVFVRINNKHYFFKLLVPLDPQMAMFRGLLLLCNSLRQALPAWSRITESSRRIMAYNKQHMLM